MRRAAGAAFLALAAAAAAAEASWTERKCELYADATAAALSWTPPEGLGEEFLARHQAFLDSGCTRPHDVCPRTPQEVALADLLLAMSMSEGMASTFVPFACPEDGAL